MGRYALSAEGYASLRRPRAEAVPQPVKGEEIAPNIIRLKFPKAQDAGASVVAMPPAIETLLAAADVGQPAPAGSPQQAVEPTTTAHAAAVVAEPEAMADVDDSPANLRWLGRVICLLTAASTTTALVMLIAA